MIIEAVAQYVRCGDGPSDEWMDLRLNVAQYGGAILSGHRVFGEWQGGYLPLVLFTFRFAVVENGDGGLGFDEAKMLAENIAAAIVGESDVQVLGLKAVE